MNQENGQRALSIDPDRKSLLDKRIKKFAGRLKREFPDVIRHNERRFKSYAAGMLKGNLPRARPGRQGNPEVQRAAEIYEWQYKSQGKAGNWHEIAKRVIPGYADLPLEIQKYRRIQLRANVHSHLYDTKSRARRTS